MIESEMPFTIFCIKNPLTETIVARRRTSAVAIRNDLIHLLCFTIISVTFLYGHALAFGASALIKTR